MWEYIVMGQIPGTHLQVNFNTWVWIVAILAGLWLARNIVRFCYSPAFTSLILSTVAFLIRFSKTADQAAYSPS